MYFMSKNLFIPQTAEYALRAMSQLALLPWEASVTSEQLATFTDIPRNYLSKILRKLVEGNLLTAEKGPGGGFRLAKAPSKITFLEILTAVGYEIATDRCAFGWNECKAANPCPLHDTYKELESLFFNWASGTTLSSAQRTSEAMTRLVKLGVEK
jgi:Rrf2 family transcriptional regulator, iron-sulfur cluster assembly transcription factor